ncbi:sulfite exporter TauE/SafE family protein [Candidatus Bathyarchaeota archaeon]|nr:MAG: sulfite exporter TauE/SafE family protein [Candidatus Bathyarchaeota archaeon]
MAFTFETLILLVLFGFFVGMVAAMAGIGGGVFIVPTLSLIFGFTSHNAVGTSLAVIVFTSLTSTFAYSRQRRIDYKIGLVSAIMTIPGALVGAYLTTLINERLLGVIFSIFLIFVALRMLLNLKMDMNVSHGFLPRKFGLWHRRIIDSAGERFEYEANILLGFALSFFGGLSSGLLGIGGGAVMVPIMHLAMGMPIHITVATSMFIMVFTSISGVLQHLSYGNVNLEYAACIALGVVFGAQLGAYTARKVPSKSLRRFFGVILLIISFRLLLKFV